MSITKPERQDTGRRYPKSVIVFHPSDPRPQMLRDLGYDVEEYKAMTDINRTKAQIADWGFNGRIYYKADDSTTNFETEVFTNDVHALSDSHTKLLEAAKAIEAHWAAGNFSREERLWRPLKDAIKEADASTTRTINSTGATYVRTASGELERVEEA